jgi:hypothetical protein
MPWKSIQQTSIWYVRADRKKGDMSKQIGTVFATLAASATKMKTRDIVNIACCITDKAAQIAL